MRTAAKNETSPGRHQKFPFWRFLFDFNICRFVFSCARSCSITIWGGLANSLVKIIQTAKKEQKSFISSFEKNRSQNHFMVFHFANRKKCLFFCALFCWLSMSQTPPHKPHRDVLDSRLGCVLQFIVYCWLFFNVCLGTRYATPRRYISRHSAWFILVSRTVKAFVWSSRYQSSSKAIENFIKFSLRCAFGV